MNPTPEPAAFDELKCRLIGWIFQLPQTPDLEAAEQIVRARIHPELYQSAQRLRSIMQQEGPGFVRRVAQRVGTADILRVFPQTVEYIQAFEHGSGDTQYRAHIFCDLSTLAAIVDAPLLERLTAAVIMQKVSHDILRVFGQYHGSQHNSSRVTHDQFWQTFGNLKRAEQHTPTHIDPYQHSVVVRTHNDQSYNIDAHLRMVDSLRHAYHVELQEPVVLRESVVDNTVTIPLQRAMQHGITMDIAFERAYQLFTEPIRCAITPQQLTQVQQRGSAVYAYIGRSGAFRLFEEDIDPFPGEPHPLPSGHVAAVRVTPTLAEVTRLDRSTRLTIFV